MNGRLGVRRAAAAGTTRFATVARIARDTRHRTTISAQRRRLSTATAAACRTWLASTPNVPAVIAIGAARCTVARCRRAGAGAACKTIAATRGSWLAWAVRARGGAGARAREAENKA